MFWSCIIFVICFILLICIVFINIYNKYQILFIKIDEAENNIDIILQKKLDCFMRATPIIKENVEGINNFLDASKDIDIKLLNNFQMNEKIKKLQIEFNNIIDLNKNLTKVESLNHILNDLYDNTNDLEGAEDYYNDTVTTYNKLVKTIPFSIIAKIFKYNYKDFYLNEDYEIFEILKKK